MELLGENLKESPKSRKLGSSFSVFSLIVEQQFGIFRDLEM